MRPFQIYADEEDDEKTPFAPPPPPGTGLNAAFVVYDDNSPERGTDGDKGSIWDLLEQSNERLSPTAMERLARETTPARRGNGSPPDDIVTPIKALSFEQTDTGNPFTPLRGRSPGATPGTRVYPAVYRRTRVMIDAARETVSVQTPDNGRQSVIARFPGAAAVDNTLHLVSTLKGALLETRVLDKDGETAVVTSQLPPVVKNSGKRGVSCRFMRLTPVSRVENEGARPNQFDPVRVDAPEHLGVFTIVPAYFRGSRRRDADVLDVQPCNLMYSMSGSDVTVIQPGTAEHVSTVNHVILTLVNAQRALLKLAIHKRVWAYGLERLNDTLHFVNIPLRGLTGEMFDCSISAKVIAADQKERRPSLAYVFITGIKFVFPPSVRTLAVEQSPVRAPVRRVNLFSDDGAGAGGLTANDKGSPPLRYTQKDDEKN